MLNFYDLKATLFLLGEAVGCMAGGWISTFIGRRLTLFIFGIPVGLVQGSAKRQKTCARIPKLIII